MSKEKKMLTKNGYDPFEVASALQKCIRRSNEYNAVYWATELETFNKTMLWNRLRVIASEDIGLANSNAPLIIDTLEKNYADALDRKNYSSRLFLVHAVLYLAKSPKNRCVDDLLITVYGQKEFENLKLAMPDYALDMHTVRGQSMKRDLKHFLEEGIRLVNEAGENSYKGSAARILMKYGKP